MITQPAFNDDWAGLCSNVTNMVAVFSMLTRALHGILGFSGPIYDSIRNLAPCELVPALRIIYDNHASVTQASVSYEWSFWYGRTHIPGENMKAFTDDVRKLANELDCHGHALTIVRPGPDARSILQRLVDMVRAADASTFGIDLGLAEGFLDGHAVSTVQLKTFIAKLIVTSRAIYGSSSSDASSSMVGAIMNRSESCAKCGGYGHNVNICPTPGRLAIKDDGTSKPDPTKDRDYKERDDANGTKPRGTRRKQSKFTDITRPTKGTRAFKWTPELGPCRHCGKDGHLNRDCESDQAKAAEEGRLAARAAKVAAGATPAAIYAMDVQFQLESDAEIEAAALECQVVSSPAPSPAKVDLPVSPLRVVPDDATPVTAAAADASAAAAVYTAATPDGSVALAPAMELALHAVIALFAMLLAYFVYLEVGSSADDGDWGDSAFAVFAMDTDAAVGAASVGSAVASFAIDMALPLLGCVSVALLCVLVWRVCVSVLGWRAPPTSVPSITSHVNSHAPVITSSSLTSPHTADAAAHAAHVATRAASAATRAFHAASSAFKAAWIYAHAGVDVYDG
jgi:hypothetical protein